MNIDEIARLAGVSRATVSRYLNNGYVSQEKRARIRQVIKETGYVPSQQAQQLRTGKTHLVGVVMPKINSQSVSRMVAGITSVLDQDGYHLVLANTNNDAEAEVEYLRLFSRRSHVDGIILIATVFTPMHEQVISRMRVPFVALGQRIPERSCVYQDDYQAVRDMTRLALRKGTRPAYLGVLTSDEAAGAARHRGFEDACAEAGITPEPEAQLVVDFDADAGYFGAERLLEACPAVDTVVCATDDIAFGAMMCMAEYGRRVPQDVQVTGVGDSLLSRIARPSLTTAHLHYKTSGMEAARMLLEDIRTGRRGVREVKMPYAVYARNSVR